MYPHCLLLRQSALPYRRESSGQDFAGMLLVHLVNECDIRTSSKDQRKLLIGRSEDVVDR